MLGGACRACHRRRVPGGVVGRRGWPRGGWAQLAALEARLWRLKPGMSGPRLGLPLALGEGLGLAERALYDPASWQCPEAGFLVGPAHGLQHEVPECGFVHEFAAAMRTIGKHVIQSRPTLADRIEDCLSTRAVANVGGCQV